ncbi:MAG: asparagine synthase (glutamine-hydrolyzing) [Rhodanobacter sp.]|nr:MAG: asparagine synthase (glutamine-hydrolyzing) [Rhodanobacter sp.]
MCGICGILAIGGQVDGDMRESAARAMLTAMAHRGPDGGQVVVRESLAMGANRLAIRSAGDDKPPLFEGDDGLVVVCNGEIDNHRELRSWLLERGHVITRQTDVAVIGPLYRERGLAFVDQLEGVFALAIWDPAKKQLLLARDRVGERHLYYARSDRGTTCFASELGALKAAPAEPAKIDVTAISGYLGTGYARVPDSPFKGVCKVAPGEVVTIDRSGVHHHTYWQCPIGGVAKKKPTLKAFDAIFRRAIYRQSDVDVDYGVLLSGGVDSALLTAVVRSVRPDKHPVTYGIRFAENSFDESEQAAAVAQLLDCRFVPVTVSAQDVPGTLRDLIATTGELLADPAWVPLSLVARRAAEDVRIVLGGEGADELFGGYPTYLGAHFAGYYAGLPSPLRTALRHLVERLPVNDKKVTVSFLLKRFVQGQQLDALARHLLWTSNIQPGLLHRLRVSPPIYRADHPVRPVLDEVQRYDFEQTLPEALMAKADRGGMRHALEVRAPFLDQSVIEFAATLPTSARVRGLTTKAFLKQYALTYLPRSVVHRRKRGLSVPLAAWLRGPLLDWTESRLSGPLLAMAGVDAAAAVKLLDEHRARTHDHSRALWTLIVLSEWLEWATAPVPVTHAIEASRQASVGVP